MVLIAKKEDALTGVSGFVDCLKRVWGEGLISVVLFGSHAARKAKPASDVDLLIIKSGLPRNRYERRMKFLEFKKTCAQHEDFLAKLSVILLTPEEARITKPYYLGMLHASRILFDRDDFFAGILADLQVRLRRLGSRRLFDRDGYEYWILKKDYQLGEAIEL